MRWSAKHWFQSQKNVPTLNPSHHAKQCNGTVLQIRWEMFPFPHTNILLHWVLIINVLYVMWINFLCDVKCLIPYNVFIFLIWQQTKCFKFKLYFPIAIWQYTSSDICSSYSFTYHFKNNNYMFRQAFSWLQWEFYKMPQLQGKHSPAFGESH